MESSRFLTSLCSCYLFFCEQVSLVKWHSKPKHRRTLEIQPIEVILQAGCRTEKIIKQRMSAFATSKMKVQSSRKEMGVLRCHLKCIT